MSGKHTAKSRKKRSLLRLAALLFTLLLVGVGATGYLYGKVLERRLHGDGSGSEEIDPSVTAVKPDEPITILLLGSDKRATDKDQGRSDSLMILRVHPKKNVVSVLSIPRDMRVYIPDYGYDKINAAYSLGGPKLTIETVEEFTGLEMNHFIEIDFQGFKRVVDALGGVDIDVKPPNGASRLKDYEVELDIPAGPQHMNGDTALKFVRVRYVDDDFGRAGRQQEFLKAVFDKAKQPSSFAKLPELINIMTENVKTDSGLGFAEIYKYGQLLRSVPKKNVHMATLPGEVDMIDEISFVIPVEEKVSWLLERMRNDRPFEMTKEELANAEIVVDVLNGSGTVGQGKKMADELRVKGFTIGEVTNADSFAYDQTQIKTSPEGMAQARKVKDALGLGEIVSDQPSGSPVVVIVGSDFASFGDSSG
ncbi:MAG: LCP family protein [Candidatus Aquicultorales bacterium]